MRQRESWCNQQLEPLRPFVSDGVFERFSLQIEEQKEDGWRQGARVEIGGMRKDSRAGVFFQPTVLTGVDHSMRIMREETFGPVVPIMVVRDADEAIDLANQSPYGLNASVWTRDIERGIAVGRRIDSGSVCVNECLVSAGCHELPFGGVKQSGVGARHGGAEGIRQFCVAQATLVEKSRRPREPAWFPYSTKQARLLERVMGLLFR